MEGTPVFERGVTEKTVSVVVLEDAHDDDGETLTLTLSNPKRAMIVDGEAVGTIRNNDPVPKAWLALRSPRAEGGSSRGPARTLRSESRRKTDMVPVRQGWLVRAMTERGFHTRDRVVVLALVLVGVVNIAVNVGSVVVDQHVRDWIGWGDAAEKQIHEHTSLSRSSYEGLSRRWKQVLADVFMGSDKHLPAAVELLGWLGTEELDAIEKIAPLVLNRRAVYADDMEEISSLSGVTTKNLLRLKEIGIVDETQGFVLDASNAGTQMLLTGGNVHLFVTTDTGRFGLSRLILTPAGSYIVNLLQPETDLAYLRQVAEEVEKNGASVEMVYGEVEDTGDGWNLRAKTKLAWKRFEEPAGNEDDGASQPAEL